MRLAVNGIGVVGPGVADWPTARNILREGDIDWRNGSVDVPIPSILNPRERRRSSDTVRLALAVGLQACTAAEIDPAILPAVFASSHGEGSTTHRLMTALSDPDPLISPTLFHNSVHNAPAGYWSISVQSHEPTASLSAGDATSVAGLLKAANVVETTGGNVLLVVYDGVFPDPLGRVCPIAAPLGAGFVFGPEDSGARHGRLSLSLLTDEAPERSSSAQMRYEQGAPYSPVGEIVELLRVIAGETEVSTLMTSGGWPPLRVDFTP